MKYLKMLGLAAVAVAAVMAFVGAGTASAAVLCTAIPEPGGKCPTGKDEPKETEIVGSLTASAKLENASGGTAYDTCSGGEVRGTTSTTGGAGNPITGSIATLSWSGCTNTTHTLKTGSLSIAWKANTNDGTLTVKETEVTVNIAGVSCTFGAGTGLDLGTLTGGAEATLDISVTVPKTAGSFLCPTSAVWIANYKITNLTPLYIADK